MLATVPFPPQPPPRALSGVAIYIVATYIISLPIDLRYPPIHILRITGNGTYTGYFHLLLKGLLELKIN
jgi:hypothetical protein